MAAITVASVAVNTTSANALAPMTRSPVSLNTMDDASGTDRPVNVSFANMSSSWLLARSTTPPTTAPLNAID